MGIYKPEGKVIEFWLWADDRKDLDKLLKSKDITEIEWIKEEEPDFI